MNIIKTRKNYISLALFTYGLLAYLFLATFNPFLHNHSSYLLQQDCEYHTAHTQSDAEDHEPRNNDSDCPTCEFLLKAYNVAIPEITLLSLNNSYNHSSVFPTYQHPHQEKYFSLYLQRAPPPKTLS